MKKIIILIAIFCCMVNARVLTYSKTINHVKCTVRVNPEKGRVDVGKCNVLGIYFMDKDDMLVTAYDDTLIANKYYSNVDFFAYEEENYVKDVAKIIVKFEEPEDPAILRKAKRNHYHRTSDGTGWECDDGYIWGDDGDHCVKDNGFNKNNCPPAWQNADGTCMKGW